MVLAQETDKYLPLVVDTQYTYLEEFNGKAHKKTLVTCEYTYNDLKVVYFIDKNEINYPTAIIGPNMIGLGAYTSEVGAIYTYDCFWLEDLSKISKSKRRLIFQKTLKKGDSLSIKSDNGRKSLVYTVVEFETVTVPAGTFEGAAKIHIQETWAGKSYNSYAWLAKGVGVVIWVRSTGKVDKLLSYNRIPSQLLTSNK